MSNFLNTEQLAKRWGRHVVTIRKWRSQGTGPKFIKLGRVVLYPLKEVEKEESKLRSSTTDNLSSKPN